MLFSVADLFSLSLPFRPTASQAESGSSEYLCLVRVPACESLSLLDGGPFHSLCGGLALSWRWVPSSASSWC